MVGAGAVIRQGEACGVGHLARADGLGRVVVDLCPRLEDAGLSQRIGQPLRRDVGRGVEQADRGHGGTRLDIPRP